MNLSSRSWGAACGIAALACLVSAPAAQAQTTIAQNTAGTVFNNAGYFGQSFTTQLGGSYTNIAFNFFSNVPATTAAAFGNGYLFSQAYIGTPGNLAANAAGTTGYLGVTTASGGFYTFGSGVTLAGGTQYFLYEDALIPNGSITGGNTAGGGGDYFTPTSNTPYVLDPSSSNYRVTSTAIRNPALTPEAPALVNMAGALLAPGIGGIVTLRKRRKKA